MYRRAIDEQSTSPFYLLFTLHDPKSGVDRIVCTSAPFLLGAIHTEYHLDYDDAGIRKARQIALSQPRHRFSFTSRKARKNIRPYYDDEVLSKVRALLASKSNAELIRDGTLHVRHPHYTLGEIYRKPDLDTLNAYRDATAHVMLERGILVGNADITGQVFVVR